jgi:CelD/BcsL family acetyltransferase involved in cellulose biosynthesis
MLAVSRVDTPEAFCALRADWDALVTADPTASVFLTWEWLHSWWEVYGAKRQLFVLLAKDDQGRLRGIAPLMKCWTRIGPVPVRTVQFISAHSTASEYLDFISAQDDKEQVARTFLSYLCEEKAWDLFLFHQIPEGSVTRWMLTEQTPPVGLRVSPLEAQPSLYIPLPPQWDAYLTRLKHHARNDIRRYRRRLETAGGYQIVERSDDPDQSLVDFETLHMARMQDARRVTSFSSSEFRRFHALVASRCAERGRLRMVFLKIGGRNVGALYGFVFNERFFFYNSGFDPNFRDQNVATVLLSHCIEDCIAAGLREFDFLSSGDYKTRWGVSERQKFSFALSPYTSIIHAYRLAKYGRNMVRTGLRQAVPTGVHELLRNQRKNILLRFQRPLS